MYSNKNESTEHGTDTKYPGEFIADDDMGDRTAPAPTDIFKVCLLTSSDPERLSKRIEEEVKGQPVKIAGGEMVKGDAQVRAFSDLRQFADFLETLKPNQALTYGLPRGGDGPVIAKGSRKTPPPGKQFRTKDAFAWPNGAGVFMVDYDHHDGDDSPLLSREELLARIVQVMPALADVQVLWRPSGSSCVYREADNSEVFGVNGQRLYFIVDDASCIPKIGTALIKRLWLAGHGRIEISKSAATLPRTDADGSVWQTNRLDFAGGAEMGPGLYQDRGECVLMGGTTWCLRAADVPAISAQEEEDYNRLVAAKRKALAQEVAAAKGGYADANAEKQAARRGISVRQARNLILSVLDGAPLDLGWLITLDDGQEVTVKDCLKDPEKYHGRYCRDPIEPKEAQPQVAYLRLLDRKPAIYSHKTGTWYPLRVARAVLSLASDAINEVTEDVARVLAKSGEYYVHGRQIVTVNDAGNMVALRDAGLLYAVDRVCSFEAHKPAGKGENRGFVSVRQSCPEQVGKRLMALADTQQVDMPSLVGVAKNPILTPDGAVVEEPGYHAGTGVMLVNTTGTPWQPVARHPTQADIAAAFRTLWEPFRLFPYADDKARSVALAAILTAVIRPSLDVAPGVMFTAPMAGTGKSYLAEALGNVAGGFMLSTVPNDPREFDKQITSLLLCGAGCYVLDNASGRVGTSDFDALLTNPSAGKRILGKSETVAGHRALWLLTGNNAQLRGDTTRRVLTCYLDAHTERVLDRRFNFDPRAKAKAQRQAIVHAALTLLIAWTGAEDYKHAGGGAFAAWTRLVAGCVGWLDGVLHAAGAGLADDDGNPLHFVNPAPFLQEQALEDDADRTAWGAFLAAWWALADADAADLHLTAKQAHDLVVKYQADVRTGTFPMDAQALFAAALLETTDRPLASSRSVGKLFAAYDKTPVGGLRLVKAYKGTANAEHGHWYWRVEKA